MPHESANSNDNTSTIQDQIVLASAPSLPPLDLASADEAARAAKRATSQWVSLEPNDPVSVAVIQVHPYPAHDSATGKARCPGHRCEYCATGQEPRVRYLLAVWLEGRRRALDATKSLYDQIRALATRYPLHRYMVSIVRQGTGLHTRYYASQGGEITASIAGAISASVPLDLEAMSWRSARPSPAPRRPTTPNTADAPF